jgi:hypothetical protein
LWKDEFSVHAADERYVTRRQFTKFLVLTSLAMFVGQVWILVKSWFARQPVAPPQQGIARIGEIGVGDVQETLLSVSVEYGSFDEWWEPLTHGVGPAGTYLATLEPEHHARLRERCREAAPEGRLTVTARAWAARGRT